MSFGLIGYLPSKSGLPKTLVCADKDHTVVDDDGDVFHVSIIAEYACKLVVGNTVMSRSWL